MDVGYCQKHFLHLLRCSYGFFLVYMVHHIDWFAKNPCIPGINPTWSWCSVQFLSHVQLFATPWTAAGQASLSITNCRSLLKLMSIESVIPSNPLILCQPFIRLPSIFSRIRVFSSESFFLSSGQNIGVSTSASVLPMNIQYWFPLGLTSWISLQSKGLSRVFSNTTVQKHQFFDEIAQLSL